MTMLNRHTLNRDNRISRDTRHDGDTGVTGVTGSTGIQPRKCPDTDRTFVRPKKVQIYFNGNRNFKGKVVQINPHRYNNFEDLLDDLTAKLPADSSMSHGVRQVFTPVTGRRVKNLSQLEEGCKYVCAGFESFKPINYGFDRSQSDHAGE